VAFTADVIGVLLLAAAGWFWMAALWAGQSIGESIMRTRIEEARQQMKSEIAKALTA